jgi:hypothetical protein
LGSSPCSDPRVSVQAKVESGPERGPDHEGIEVHGRADHCRPTGAGGRGNDGRRVPQARDQFGHVLRSGQAKFGGLEVSDAKRLKGLEDENTKLKRLLAEAMLDNVALKDLLAKKW